MKNILFLILLSPSVLFAQGLPTGCIFPDEIDPLFAYGPNDRVLPSLNKALCIINALQEEVVRKGSEVSTCVSNVEILPGRRICMKFNFPSTIDTSSPVRLSVVSDDISGSVITDGTSSITEVSVDGCFFNTDPDKKLKITACASGVPE